MAAEERSDRPEIRLRRLRMRSWRRGTREMDLLLGAFADAKLADLSPAEIDAYEAVIAENDHDLYRWVSGGTPAPKVHSGILALIRRHHGVG